MRENGKEFLGSGWKFPVDVDASTGRISMSYYEDNIRESIYIIVMTRPGERIMRPEFGCHIYDFIFMRPDNPVRIRMENTVRESLVRWEPRIKDINVHADIGNKPGKVIIRIDYTVRSTNNPYNIVFPFYINEGFRGE